MYLVFSYDEAVDILIGNLRMTDKKWLTYEQFKKRIKDIGLTEEQYEIILRAYLEAVGL
jgi:hypothetical protein